MSKPMTTKRKMKVRGWLKKHHPQENALAITQDEETFVKRMLALHGVDEQMVRAVLEK